MTCRYGCLEPADAKPDAAAMTAVTSDTKPASEMPLPFINIAAWQDQAVPDRAMDGEGPHPDEQCHVAFRRGINRQVNFVLASQHCRRAWVAIGWEPCPSRDRRSSCVVRTTPRSYGGVLI